MKRLGSTGLNVSDLALGTWGLGGPLREHGASRSYGPMDKNDAIRVIHEALDAGISLIDTADVYGAVESERVVGRALAGRRETVILATKWGHGFDEHNHEQKSPEASPRYVRRALHDSLNRLGTDYVDIYQLHINDLPATQALELASTLQELVGEGLIRFYGWSTNNAASMAEFFELGGGTVVQYQMNALDGPCAMTDWSMAHHCCALVRSPLAMGLLAREHATELRFGPDDIRGPDSPEWLSWFKNGEPSGRWLQLREMLRPVLTRDGRTLAQGAIAWIHANAPHAVPIVGARSVGQVKENFLSSFEPLSNEDLAEVEDLRATWWHTSTNPRC